MLKPHCDRCDKLIETSTCSWVEFMKPGTSREEIAHLRLNVGSQEAMLCNDCIIILLLMFVKEIGIPEKGWELKQQIYEMMRDPVPEPAPVLEPIPEPAPMPAETVRDETEF